MHKVTNRIDFVWTVQIIRCLCGFFSLVQIKSVQYRFFKGNFFPFCSGFSLTKYRISYSFFQKRRKNCSILLGLFTSNSDFLLVFYSVLSRFLRNSVKSSDFRFRLVVHLIDNASFLAAIFSVLLVSHASNIFATLSTNYYQQLFYVQLKFFAQ